MFLVRFFLGVCRGILNLVLAVLSLVITAAAFFWKALMWIACIFTGLLGVAGLVTFAACLVDILRHDLDVERSYLINCALCLAVAIASPFLCVLCMALKNAGFALLSLLPAQRKKARDSSVYARPRPSGFSASSGTPASSGPSGYSGSSAYSGPQFSSTDYVRAHCPSYVYGATPSAADISQIESDSSLTFEQKEAAKQELDRLSALYY